MSIFDTATYQKHRYSIQQAGLLVACELWFVALFNLPESLALYFVGASACVLLYFIYFIGRSVGRKDMRKRLLGLKWVKDHWECKEGTEITGMKWVDRHWAYEDGKQVRRVNYINDHWEFEDGTRPGASKLQVRDIGTFGMLKV